jgi:hypothetical protein
VQDATDIKVGSERKVSSDHFRVINMNDRIFGFDLFLLPPLSPKLSFSQSGERFGRMCETM